MVQGKYEVLLQKALEREGPGPWNKHDVDRVRDTLTQDLCLAFDPDCDKDAVLDWLSALPPVEMEALIRRLNAEQAGADP